MKLRIILALAAVAACTSAAPTSSSRASSTSSSSGSSGTTPTTGTGGTGGGIVLTGGSVVDPATKTVTMRALYICDGVVVDETRGQSCATQTIDVTGKFLMPGLTDMHVHTRGVSKGDESFVDSTVEAESPLFRVAGVTQFLDAMSDETKIFPARDAQRASATKTGADIFTAGAAFTPTNGHGTEYGLPAPRRASWTRRRRWRRRWRISRPRSPTS